jgi:hypothetical protein
MERPNDPCIIPIAILDDHMASDGTVDTIDDFFGFLSAIHESGW